MIGVVDSIRPPVNGAELYTLVVRPAAEGTFPIIITRNPYVDEYTPDEQTKAEALAQDQLFLENGYALVHQHCRGRGLSTGDCIPYINERADGLALLDWIRRQPFYQQELYLSGGSYLTSVHYAIAPFANDIKGAVLEIQDCERYRVLYHNGFFKAGLHGNWYVGMFKHNSHRVKNYTEDSFRMLPLADFSQTVFGEPAPDLDEALKHPNPNDAFWQTLPGGSDARDAVKHANIPILLVTHFYDIYTHGVFDMWKQLSPETREQCALLVSPYDHGGTWPQYATDGKFCKFPNGVKNDAFPDYPLRWFNAVRNKGYYPFVRGKVTYYRLFENCWRTDDFQPVTEAMRIPLGTETFSYTYNPYNPATFRGGLAENFGGAQYQDAPNSRYDIKSVYTAPFEKDCFVRGTMTAHLSCASDCEDTCFYIRLSLALPEGDYGIRDDIQQISNVDAQYVPNTAIGIDFSFAEHAFLVRKGQRLRIDISSSAWPHYVPHTNQRGLYSEQTTAKIAHNTVFSADSFITLPVERDNFQ